MLFIRVYKESGITGKLLIFSLLILLFSTAVSNRLTTDDLFFVYRIREVGLKGCIDQQYSRIAAYFLNACVIAVNSRVVFVLYNLISIFLFFFLLSKLSTELFFRNLRIGFLFSLFVFFCITQSADVFFWYTQVSTYLWCLNSLLFILLVLTGVYKSKASYVLFFSACLFAPSASEFLSLQFIVLLGIALVRGSADINRYRSWVFPAGALLFMVSLAVTLFSPGMAARSALVNHPLPGQLVLLSAKHFLIYCYSFFSPDRLFLLVVFVLLFFSEGVFSKRKVKVKNIVFLLAPVFIYISIFSLTYSTADLAPPRALLICDVMVLFLLAATAINIGASYQGSQRINAVKYSVHLILVIVCVFYSWQAGNYSIAYDEREIIIGTSSANPIVVRQLPDCFFIHSNKLSSDSMDYRNQHLRLAHNINAQLVVKSGY